MEEKEKTYRRFRRRRKWPWVVLIFFAAIALFADFLANEKPLYCKLEGKTYFPALYQYGADLGIYQWPPELTRARWRELTYEKVVFAPIPYSATTRDVKNTHFAHPFRGQQVESMRHWHWLGTDQLGRDVAAGMIAGARIALLVGFGAMALASLVGVFLGVLAGYFGDRGLKAAWLRLILNAAGFYLGVFYGFISRSYIIGEANAEGEALGAILPGLAWVAGVLALANALSWVLERTFRLRKNIPIPTDVLVMRAVEIMESIPGLLLILALASLVRKPSVWYVMLIIGLTAWPSVAQFMRAEMLKVRGQTYIEAARALGFSSWRIMFRHALPNALSPVLILIAFGVARAVLAEASLSFLGIGLGPEEVTWGKLLSEARSNFSAWWLAVFPGAAIFVLVLVFNLIGEELSERS